MDSPSPEKNSSGSPLNGPRPAGGGPPRSAYSPAWIVLFLFLALALYLSFGTSLTGGSGARVDYSFFRSQLEQKPNGNVKEVTFNGDGLTGVWKTPPEDPAKAGTPL